jgi:hypothetical protein
MEKEIFKDIPNYEGLYQVSNLGNVKSLERIVTRPKSGNYIVKERILKHNKDGAGYYKLLLCKDGNKKGMKVHVLVAMAFLKHIPNGHKIQVDHINNDKLDNRVENLQLISSRENSSKDRKGSSKYTGVSWNKQRNKWHSNIRIDGKNKHLGLFTDEYEANIAYQKALEMYNNGDLSFMKSKKSSKYKGVSWYKPSNKWKAVITIDGKLKHLGHFTDEYEAHLTYQKALHNLNNN